jgi:hypothetical protein
MVEPLRLDGEDAIDTAGLEAHREHSFAKLDAMQRYAESALSPSPHPNYFE